MRLRFREAGIKRLEAVACGKISAETHLLKEKEEHLKEIEVLRAQVDRNQEVTRFAMENLRLKEEIRRYVFVLMLVESSFITNRILSASESYTVEEQIMIHCFQGAVTLTCHLFPSYISTLSSSLTMSL